MGMTGEERRMLKGGGATIEPLAVSIADAVRLSGLSRSEIYRRGAAGDLDIVKSGGRSLVIVASIKDYIARLPRAVLRVPISAA
jgi:hypothetical protein